MRWVLVEATQRILPEVDRGHGRVHGAGSCSSATSTSGSDTRLESCVDGVVKLSDGDSFRGRHDRLDGRRQAVADARRRPTCRATSGAGSPACRRCRSSTATAGGRGRVERRRLRGGARPDRRRPARCCSPSAQHAVRQAARLADNIRAVIRGRAPKDYKHKHVGSVASLGLHKGVAQVYGIKLKGLAGLVHAPHVPHEPDPVAQPQGPRGRRLDAGAVPASARWSRWASCTHPREEFTEVTPRIEVDSGRR